MRAGTILRRLWRRFGHPPAAPAKSVEYWHWRAEELGARAVVDVRYSAAELPLVTQSQCDMLFPVVRAELEGWESRVLDVGCGIGRFTPWLAELVEGEAIGVEPVADLLALAPAHERVRYALMEPGRIPLENESVDMVWIFTVLGGLGDEALRDTVSEVRRVLVPNGLVLLAENEKSQSEAPPQQHGAHWVSRAPSEYVSFFDWCDLRCVLSFPDWDNSVALMTGRRRR